MRCLQAGLYGVLSFAILDAPPAEAFSRYEAAVGNWSCIGMVNQSQPMGFKNYTGQVSLGANGEMSVEISIFHRALYVSELWNIKATGGWHLSNQGITIETQQFSACDPVTGACRGNTEIRDCNSNGVCRLGEPLLDYNLRMDQGTLYVANSVACRKISGPGVAAPPPLAGMPSYPFPGSGMPPFPPSRGSSSSGYDQLLKQMQEEDRQHCQRNANSDHPNPWLNVPCAGKY
jgi:hypothetical protein